MFNSLFLGLHKKKALAGARKFLETKIESLMTKYVVTTKPSMSVVQAATRMVAQDISCLVVVDEDDSGKAVGIITERDFLRKVPANSSALKLKVKDVMSNKIVSVTPDQTLHEAHKMMREHGFRKLVVTTNGRLQGVLTQTDIVKHAALCMKKYAASKSCVSDWMTKKIVSVSPSTSFAEAKKKMTKSDVGALLIKGKSFAGIFTEFDIVAQFYDQGGMLHIKNPKEVMHEHIRSIEVKTDIMVANRIMIEKKVRRLLVLSATDVVGIITQTDIANAVVAMAEELLNKKFFDSITKVSVVPKKTIESNYITENFKLYSTPG